MHNPPNHKWSKSASLLCLGIWRSSHSHAEDALLSKCWGWNKDNQFSPHWMLLRQHLHWWTDCSPQLLPSLPTFTPAANLGAATQRAQLVWKKIRKWYKPYMPHVLMLARRYHELPTAGSKKYLGRCAMLDPSLGPSWSQLARVRRKAQVGFCSAQLKAKDGQVWPESALVEPSTGDSRCEATGISKSVKKNTQQKLRFAKY